MEIRRVEPISDDIIKAANHQPADLFSKHLPWGNTEKICGITWKKDFSEMQLSKEILHPDSLFYFIWKMNR